MSDASRLAVLCTQLGYPAETHSLEERLRKNFDNPRRATFVSTDNSDVVVGFVDLDFRCIMVNDGCAEICGLVIDENCRGCGYGKELIKKAEEWAIAMGACELSLRSNVVREEAHVFYKKLGFEVYKKQLAFRKHLNLEAEKSG